MENSPLVSSDWLLSKLDNPGMIVLDATLAKPKAAGIIPNNDIQIPGAQFFDIDHAFSDKSSNLPHMMCDAEQFEKEVQRLGIKGTSEVVVYDNHGVYSSPRAWWMLKSMGLEQVYVLNGGLPEWIEKGYPTEEKGNNPHLTGDFVPTFNTSCFVTKDFVLNHLEAKDIIVLDARSEGRFKGTEPEPREGLRGGHIPNASSLPFTEVVEGFRMNEERKLKELMEPLNLNGKRLIFSCGSGLTAGIILLAAKVAGYDNLSIYDGSWSEWGQPSDLPVATG